jgi:hypothetical protein
VCQEYAQLGQEHERVCQEYAQLGQEHERVCQENARLLQEKDYYESKVKALEGEIEGIYASRSWQITSPYRRLGGWLKKS